MGVLVELGEVLRSAPGMNAPAEAVAAWYERKAVLFEHVAAEGGPDASSATTLAQQAHRHAFELLTEVA
ncbi:hypothetical protein FKR81_12680 [Lentzea tibetensis]|uniref:Uncharacterized protein n=1 Tax=Lentzea tibetensis TaxID=2591470 RepID=A0A563EVH7_9PSEU|nr:hypothetical protein [Lentzea tibetensis]TWP51717.1 hypothetical protein FKR81_12680 [Lentzea tibetensis]